MDITELITNKYTTLESINEMLNKDAPYITKDDWYNISLVALQANKNTEMLRQHDTAIANFTVTADNLPDITISKILDFPVLADVATSGSYNALLDKPAFASVAFSGSYNDLVDKPTIPELPELALVATTGSYNDLNNKPVIPELPTLAAVATTGAYSDLTGKPTIPTVGTLNTTATAAQATHAAEELSGTVVLHKVSKTGLYSDLRNTPDLGTAAYKDVGVTNGNVVGVGAGNTIYGNLLPIATNAVRGGVLAQSLQAAGTVTTTPVLIDTYTGMLHSVVPAPATVDTAMSDTSTNTVQNKIIKAYVDNMITEIAALFATI